MEKTPSPFSPLPRRWVSLCLAHEWVPPFTSPLNPLCFLSPRLVDPSLCLYLAFSFSVGWFFSRLAFLYSPYPETKVPEPAQARRHSGGPQHQPVGSRPYVASLRFVSFRFVSFRFVSFRFVSFRFVSFRFVSSLLSSPLIPFLYTYIHAPRYARIRRRRKWQASLIVV